METDAIQVASIGLYAFEIEQAYIGVRTVARLLTTIEGVSDLRLRRPFSASPDIHGEFTYRGKPFIVLEPYGDSSVYWIGPRDEENGTNIQPLQGAFLSYVPPLHRRVIGDILSLRFMRRRV